MVGPKSAQTRVVGILTDEMYPYILFSSNGRGFYEKCVGMHLVCYYLYFEHAVLMTTNTYFTL